MSQAREPVRGAFVRFNSQVLRECNMIDGSTILAQLFQGEETMSENAGHSGRLREINPDELDFGKDENSGQFDFDAKDRRRFHRASLDVPITLTLLGPNDKELCKGKALLRDLSLDGAFLMGIEIEETMEGVKAEELGEFKRILFQILDGPFKGVKASAKPVRVGQKIGGMGVTLEKGFDLSIM
jgi:hypothetical protein